jgi:uncharacterized protein YjdB
MKRTIALVLSLLMLLVLVPTTALADYDVNPRLEVTLAPTTKTLYQYGTDLVLDWVNASLEVKLYDDTPANVDGTVLELATAISSGKYVIMIGTAVYNPAVGSQYAFQATDIGSKTLTLKYTYKPAGQTNNVTVTKNVTISVQRHILQSIEVTGPAQLSYFAGELMNLSGLVVKATYSNMTDPVTLDSSKYTLRLYKDAEGTDEITTAEALSTQNTLKVSVTEAYAGTETTVTATKTVPIVVSPSATSLSVAPSTASMTLGVTAPITLSSTVGGGSFASLVASVDKPAIVAIDTSTLTSNGEVVATALSIGTAIVTIRARGTSYTQTVSITVEKAPTPVSSLALDRTALSLPVNGTYTLTATIGPDNATDKTVKWEVEAGKGSDVSVDATGTVKVLRNFSGTVTVTATSNDNPAATQNCLISVNTIAVDGISISDTSASIYKGSWKQLSAVVTPFGAADPAITWTSSNTAVATVDSTGKVTAVGIPTGETYGEAIITAQSSNPSIFATCTIRVLQSVLITSLTLNKSELALNVGDEETLTVTGTPSNATNKVLLWTSSNPEVASVNAGKVIAASKGTTVIRAEATDGSGKFVSCVVTVNNIQILNVYLDKSSLDLSEGDTATIAATVFPSNATTKTLKWTSSNTSVATVDSKGNVVAGATKGYAIITATATDGSGKFAECVVLSKPKIHVTGLTINYGTSLDLLVNDSTYLKATILPANASVQSVTWSSSNATVASVDASTGLLKGISLGEATITATADNKTVSIKINVTNTEYNYGVAANFARRVNVRASASGLSKLVGYAYLGDTFKILGRTGSWFLIQYNNTTKAYIWASYLNPTKTAAAYTSAGSASSTGTGTTTDPSATPTTVTIANCLYSVNVRQSASTTSTRIGKANLGASFTYLGKEGDWYKIQFNSTTVGYVYGTFVILS